MPNLKPFRDYSEHDVINFFACDTVANKGTLVAPVRSPRNNVAGPLSLSSTAPGALYNNTITNNFDLAGVVTPVVLASYNLPDDPHGTVLGVLLKDVREFDENGRKLVFDSRKAAEMDAIIKDIQAVPILTRGIILVNDIYLTGGPIYPGDAAYLGANGRFDTNGVMVVGRFLSVADENGYALIKININ
jgi:hypothetical protein